MLKNLIQYYRNSEEYNALEEECRAIITEGIWNSRSELIITYGKLGKEIIENSNYKKWIEGNQNFLQDLAEDIKISYSTICRAVQFWEKYHLDSHTCESWNRFKEQKNISWHKIVQNYLPEPKENNVCDFQGIKIWKCNCGRMLKEKP